MTRRIEIAEVAFRGLTTSISLASNLAATLRASSSDMFPASERLRCGVSITVSNLWRGGRLTSLRTMLYHIVTGDDAARIVG